MPAGLVPGAQMLFRNKENEQNRVFCCLIVLVNIVEPIIGMGVFCLRELDITLTFLVSQCFGNFAPELQTHLNNN